MKVLLEYLARASCVSVFLLWPALFSGYSLFTYDSAEYINAAFSLTGLSEPHRSILYSEFIWLVTLGGRLSLWSVVICQAIFTEIIFHTVVKLCLGRIFTVSRYVLLMAVLSVFSTISWHVSNIMPDFMAPLLALAIFLLVFKFESMALVEKVAACACLLLGIGIHLSFLPTVVLSTMCFAAYYFCANSNSIKRAGLGRLILLVCGGILLMTCFTLLSGKAVTSKGKYNFLLGRLAQSGMLYRVLEKQCLSERFSLCPYLDRLKNVDVNDFLWGSWNPLFNGEVSSWGSAEQETAKLIKLSVAMYPLQNILDAVDSTASQLVKFHLVERIVPIPSENKMFWLDPVINAFPADVPMAIRAESRQLALSSIMGKLDGFQASSSWVSLIALLCLVWFTRAEFSALGGVILCYLLCNAFVCGVFSGASARYQARVMCLALLWGILKIFVGREKIRTAEIEGKK